MTTEDVLKHIVHILPNAWQYPDIASSRIVFDDHTYETQNCQESRHKQTTCIFVEGKQRGTVEVIYKEEKPELDEGPFLKEERALIDNVARQIALIIEKKEAEEAKSKLQDELRHADRLSTIGQLTTEVAHDLNEPLGNILGFAQLVKKSSNLTNQVEQDIAKIINASLHAREVIRRLMIFGRQMPPMKTNVNMNQVVEESCYFIESRCAQAGVKLVRSLSRDLPEITADPSHIKQALVNLLVNSLQAMPEGGELKVKTSTSKNCVSLVVQDTGIGMSEEIKKQIFIPFFTTKGIGQGTGLGLAVVHSIVTSYKGSIKVESEPDCGTRFEIKLPLKAE
jgi:signal transduction histidine kinase